MGSAFSVSNRQTHEGNERRTRSSANPIRNRSSQLTIIWYSVNNIHPSVHFFYKTVEVNQPKSMRSVTLSSVFSLFRFHLKWSRTVCVSSRCAPSLNRLRNNKIVKTKSPTFGVSKSFTWKRRRRFYLFVISWWWVINSIENGRKGEKGFSIVSLTLLCTILTVSY